MAKNLASSEPYFDYACASDANRDYSFEFVDGDIFIDKAVLFSLVMLHFGSMAGDTIYGYCFNYLPSWRPTKETDCSRREVAKLKRQEVLFTDG